MDNRKPVAPLIGANGNIFNLLSIARNSLIASNKPNDALEMWDRVTNSKSYNDALRIIEDYVEFGESDGQDVSDHTWTYELEEQRQKGTVGTAETGTEGIEDRMVGKVGSIVTAEKEHCRQVEFNGSIDNNNEVTKVNFTQELHITNSNIDGIMESALEEGVLNWYESISSSPTSIEKVETNLISNGGTIFFRIQGEEYSRTFDKHDLIYGLLRELPDCLHIINGDQINTAYLDNEHIDHIIQYGLFGEIEY
ncbi:hypothetical protein CACET_c27940 [Clostridium aceticum]|uniref:Uncharacterized protein n=1 Tax=Clostridium aceticum TaxID=84022 RepID=A0A0G3WFN3_9CLOT|nr:hypothetical protein [Clostridium aceticum]AKL96239.1 hypothetical protein CACET_c27940 [Clostridium aceticum]